MTKDCVGHGVYILQRLRQHITIVVYNADIICIVLRVFMQVSEFT